jgi:hypothetical protein
LGQIKVKPIGSALKSVTKSFERNTLDFFRERG